jgi:hypothetical protein
MGMTVASQSRDDAKADFGRRRPVGRLFMAKMITSAPDGTKDLKSYASTSPRRPTIGAGPRRRSSPSAPRRTTEPWTRATCRDRWSSRLTPRCSTSPRRPEDLQKDVFEFRSVRRLAGRPMVAGRSPTRSRRAPRPPTRRRGTGCLEATKPEAKDVDQTKFTDFLTTMSNLRAESFADK